MVNVDRKVSGCGPIVRALTSGVQLFCFFVRVGHISSLSHCLTYSQPSNKVRSDLGQLGEVFQYLLE